MGVICRESGGSECGKWSFCLYPECRVVEKVSVTAVNGRGEPGEVEVAGFEPPPGFDEFVDAARNVTERLLAMAQVPPSLAPAGAPSSAEVFRAAQAAWWRWELGDEFLLLHGRLVRRVRVVGVTDTGPHTREYRLREVDDGHQVFQPEADEEKLNAYRFVGAQADGEQDIVSQGRDEDRQQVGGCDGSKRWREEDRPDFSGSGGEGRREATDGEGVDGPVVEGWIRLEQARFPLGGGSAFPEGPVLGPVWRRVLAQWGWLVPMALCWVLVGFSLVRAFIASRRGDR